VITLLDETSRAVALQFEECCGFEQPLVGFFRIGLEPGLLLISIEQDLGVVFFIKRSKDTWHLNVHVDQ